MMRGSTDLDCQNEGRVEVEPLVSVVIPTYRRPHVISRSVQSVLSQTYQRFELIVILDGPDPEVREILRSFDDGRLRIVELSDNVGIARVRNTGIAESKGRWIAFLDDDDEWLPHKLGVQVAAAMQMGGDRVLLASRFVERGESFERVLPYAAPDLGTNLSDFLFARNGIFGHPGHVQTSTYFVSRALAREVSFRPEVRPQEDFDWLIRSAAKADRPFQLLPETLSIYHNEQITGREGTVGNFDTFWDYAHQNRELFSPTAFSYYLATWCASRVSQRPRPFRTWLQVVAGMRSGRLTFGSLFFAVVYGIFPTERRRRLRHFVSALAFSKQ